MRRRLVRVFGTGSLLALAAACGGRDGSGGGTAIIALGADSKSLFPTVAAGTVQGRAMVEPMFDPLADLGPTLSTVDVASFAPRLAQSWNWSSDSLTVTFAIDPRARWHDGTPIRAADVRLGYEIARDPASGSTTTADLAAAVDSVRVVDSLHVAAYFSHRFPEQFYQFVASFVPLPAHLLASIPHEALATSAFSRAPVGSGPFRFVAWKQGERFEMAAVDAFYRGRATLDRVIFSVNGDPSTLAKQLFAGEADFYELLPASEVATAATKKTVQLIRTPSMNYAFLQFNLHDGATAKPHPVLGEAGVRRAIAMALDRRAMLQNVFDGAGRLAMGPFSSIQWSADTTVRQPAFDRAAAAALLDSLGWKSGPDGNRTKSGRPLAFRIIAASSSKPRQQYAQLIQAQLREIGVKVDVEAMDPPAIGAKVTAHEFDSFIQNLTAGRSPVAGLHQTWVRGSTGPGGLNFGGYASAVVDLQADSAFSARNTSDARRHYRAVYQQIIDDAPAIFLFEQPTVSGAHTRLVTGALRPGAWWKSIEGWKIAPGGHLPRDIPRDAPPQS